MPWSFIIPAAASLIGGSMQASAAKSAAGTAAAASDRATELQRQMFEKQVELQEPWRQAGIGALNKLIPLAEQYTPFGMQQFQQDPGYAFRMAEGMKGLERSAAARGGLLSGATLKGIQQYGQGLASQEYQNAFNRYQAERAAQLNPLQSLAGIGQTSVNALTGAAGQYASNVGNIGMQQAQISANAGLARAGAYRDTLGDIGYLAGRYYRSQNQLGGSPRAYDPYGNIGAPGGEYGPG